MSDPFWSDVALLVAFDGTNGQTTFTDLSSNALTVSSAAGGAVSTTLPKFGTGCLAAPVQFSGTGAGVNVPITAGGPLDIFPDAGGDFTIEGWFRFIDDTDTRPLFVMEYGNVAGMQVPVTASIPAAAGSGAFSFAPSGFGWGTPLTSSALSFAQGDWHYWAVTRASGTGRLFIDGVQVDISGPNTWVGYTNTAVSPGIALGWSQRELTFTAGGAFDEVRITKGVARYTTNFSPPVAPFPTSGPLIVPNVVGDLPAAANTAITAIGLVVGTVTHVIDPLVAFGTVDSQTPTAGSTASSGDSVDYTISDGLGPPPGIEGIQAKFVAPSVGKAIMVANPGTINPRIYPPLEDYTVRVKP